MSLYNRSAVRRRFYWWNNAAVRVHDDSRIYYPMRFTASHWFRDVDTWPVNGAGVDLSVVGNHLYGPVSLFAHGSRETYMGVYHPPSRSGVVHYSSPLDAPTKKIWSWGGDADGLDWRRALSDDQSAYVEIQAGLFRNQETYAFLEPEETIRFSEYWMPVRGIGGISRATPEGVLNLARGAATDGKADLTVGVNVSRALAGGRLRVRDGERVIAEAGLDLTPAGVFTRTFPASARRGEVHGRGHGRRGADAPRPDRGRLRPAPGRRDQAGPAARPRLPGPGEAHRGRVPAARHRAGARREAARGPRDLRGGPLPLPRQHAAAEGPRTARGGPAALRRGGAPPRPACSSA